MNMASEKRNSKENEARGTGWRVKREWMQQPSSKSEGGV
jgi:hypothetical protein